MLAHIRHHHIVLGGAVACLIAAAVLMSDPRTVLWIGAGLGASILGVTFLSISRQVETDGRIDMAAVVGIWMIMTPLVFGTASIHPSNKIFPVAGVGLGLVLCGLAYAVAWVRPSRADHAA